MKVLISKKKGDYHYYKEESNQDFHCKEGFIKKEDLLNDDNKVVFTNINREFWMFKANKYDLTKKYKRGPQIINAKDLGYILARGGIDKNSKIVEAGGGSGAATSFFANFVKTVHTYEVKEAHCTIIKKNLAHMGIESGVELFNDDLNDKIEEEKDVDLLFLDMPNCETILEKNLDCLKSGRYIICYVPSITQIQRITEVVANSTNLYLEEISEVILRHWKVWDKVARPEHRKEIDHTAFLVFVRKN